jgi:hypothetical protein
MQKLKTRIGEISVEQVGNKFVVRLENGVALALGVPKQAFIRMIQDIQQGKFDEYAKQLLSLK